MSFAKRLTDQTLTLLSWDNFSSLENKSCKILEVFIPGVTLELKFGSQNQVFWKEKTGAISKIEKYILENLAIFYKKQAKVPTFREFDYYLRDKPQVTPWPDYFDTKFIEIILNTMSTEINSMENLAAKDFASPLEWLKYKLSEKLSKRELELIETSPDMILVRGKQEDAWVIEKDLVLWQNSIRQIYQKPNLLLLYAIKI